MSLRIPDNVENGLTISDMSGVLADPEYLETLETEDSLSISRLADEVDVEQATVEEVVSGLVDRNLVVFQESKSKRVVESEAPVPISKIGFRCELTPTQSVIGYLYEERGYRQYQMARILDYTPGTSKRILTGLKRNSIQN